MISCHRNNAELCTNNLLARSVLSCGPFPLTAHVVTCNKERRKTRPAQSTRLRQPRLSDFCLGRANIQIWAAFLPPPSLRDSGGRRRNRSRSLRHSQSFSSLSGVSILNQRLIQEPTATTSNEDGRGRTIRGRERFGAAAATAT